MRLFRFRTKLGQLKNFWFSRIFLNLFLFVLFPLWLYFYTLLLEKYIWQSRTQTQLSLYIYICVRAFEIQSFWNSLESVSLFFVFICVFQSCHLQYPFIFKFLFEFFFGKIFLIEFLPKLPTDPINRKHEFYKGRLQNLTWRSFYSAWKKFQHTLIIMIS